MINKKEERKTGWNFDNSYARLPRSFFTLINPVEVPSPRLIIFNDPLAKELGLKEEELHREKIVAALAGNEIPEGALPLAQAYAGHQFGHFTILGDGRAILLGEQITPLGKRLDIQLKGSGRTPYSRKGDGRAAVGPMLREYIISEAMHALGIPTTRSLAVVATGQTILRDTPLPGAVLTRVADSHIRVGTFQYGSSLGNIDELRMLADYTIERHFPEIVASKDKYLLMLREVIQRQAALIAQWQHVGFIHGVMNTDNMTISGETIDYGPCAFMDHYDPATVFSSIDTQGRYAYGNQPYIGAWNLARLAEALLPLLHTDDEIALSLAQEAISEFHEQYYEHWFSGMRCKLGLFNHEAGDENLIKNLLEIMHRYHADYTNTFRALTLNKLEGLFLFKSPEFIDWHISWQERLKRQKEDEKARYQLMKDSNPAIIPRNHRVEAALEAATGKDDYGPMKKLIHVLSTPFFYSSEKDDYTSPPPLSEGPYRTFCGT